MAFAVFLQKLQDELGILAHVLLISIIAVDENHQMGCVNGHLCAFVVAGRITVLIKERGTLMVDLSLHQILSRNLFLLLQEHSFIGFLFLVVSH